MSNNVIRAGIDRGFGVTKFYSDLETGAVDSLVAPISEDRAKEIIANNKDDDEVIVLKLSTKSGPDDDYQYFLVGSYVSKVEPQYAERDLRRNRTDNVSENILFLTAMGLCTKDLEKVSMIVTTGLPTDEFERRREQYAKTILHNRQPYFFSIIRKGKEYKKEITVLKANVENQPKGTIIAVLNDKLKNKKTTGEDWVDLKSKRFAVCDIGFNTTDLSIYVGKDIVHDEKVNFSTFAVVQIAKTCKRLIEEHFVCVKSEAEVIECMKTGMVKIKGKMLDCSDLIHQGFLLNAELLINEISSKWETELDTFDELILTGGAVSNMDFANILKDQISDKCGWEVTVCENSQFANAKGFYIISRSLDQQPQQKNTEE